MTQEITSSIVTTSGGLILDQDVYSMPPGAATKLQNFEPSVLGGYRRLSGTAKYSSSQPNGTNTVQGVFIYKERVYWRKFSIWNWKFLDKHNNRSDLFSKSVF